MSNVSRLKTDAEQAIARQYEARQDGAVGHALRASGFARIDADGLPHRRVEEYKYTDLKALVRTFYPLAEPTSPEALATVAVGVEHDASTIMLSIVDGVYQPNLSEAFMVPQGVTITSLREALAEGRDDIISRLSGPDIAHDDPAMALNAALMSDGVIIEVADGCQVAETINLVYVVTSPTQASVHTRSLVVLGKGASLGLIETYETAIAGHQRTDVLNLVVGDGARFEHAVAKSDASALDLSTITAVIGGDAGVQSFALITAGDVTRRQHFVRMEGDHSHLSLKGANLLKGRMHADTTLVVEHDSLDCESRELYRNVIDGEAHGVFQGKVIVRPHAQKTDGKMASNALLLSENAEMDNKPELEIYADDVACGHGATCGAIDERPIFYLMSRGLPRPDAEALLIQSFVGEVVDSVGDGPLAVNGEALRDAFTASIESWLASRSQVSGGTAS
jgi:Fe-S cluster assembly protein SufD